MQGGEYLCLIPIHPHFHRPPLQRDSPTSCTFCAKPLGGSGGVYSRACVTAVCSCLLSLVSPPQLCKPRFPEKKFINPDARAAMTRSALEFRRVKRFRNCRQLAYCARWISDS